MAWGDEAGIVARRPSTATLVAKPMVSSAYGPAPAGAGSEHRADHERERDAGEAGDRVDGGVRLGAVVAVVVGDDAGHQQHEHRARDAGERRAEQGERPHVPDAQQHDADGRRGTRTPERVRPPDPGDEARSEGAEHQHADTERRAVGGGEHTGDAQFVTEFAEHDADAQAGHEDAERHRERDRQSIPDAVPFAHGFRPYRYRTFRPGAFRARAT